VKPAPPHPARITLVLGGARSGKSAHAERLAREARRRRIYLATAQAFDDEMRERISHHRDSRADDGWTTVEEAIDLPEALARAAEPDAVVLVDCLTLWLSNWMLAECDVAQGRTDLSSTLAAARGPVILVSNEVGMGIVPDTPLGRRFRDAQGRLNQTVAAMADVVVLMAAGIPLLVKPQGV
jgi:adenosylcobinamide kinase / adenosylcobinamide-phosphate guanylyltransferase